jgi:hypothetical protein
LQHDKIIHREGWSFDRTQAASAWLAKRETEFVKPGALERLKEHDPALTSVIDRHVDASIKVSRAPPQPAKSCRDQRQQQHNGDAGGSTNVAVVRSAEVHVGVSEPAIRQ